MRISRRDFVGYCSKIAAVWGLQSTLGPMERALASTSGPPVIWLKAAGCTGCTVSLANRISTTAPVDLADLLVSSIDLVYHPTLMAAPGDLAVRSLRAAEAGTFILVVEGGIPTVYGGKTCTLWTENGVDVTALAAVKELAPKAKQVVCVGTCASFGGVSAAAPNPTGVQSVQAASGRATINVPGCPAHPDWIVWTLAQLLAGNTPALDSSRRPTTLYGKTVHSQCPRRNQPWASSLAETGNCMGNLGCKGRETYADCPSRKWNNGTAWCVGVDALCQSCTSSAFPDGFAPLFSTAGATPFGHKVVNPPHASCSTCHGKPG
jgi:hydrogenase small subunit